MRKKNLVYKNQGWKPIHQNYKAKESMNRHNPKKKQKQTINEKYGKETLTQIGPEITKWRLTITKKNLRRENSHFPQIGY